MSLAFLQIMLLYKGLGLGPVRGLLVCGLRSMRKRASVLPFVAEDEALLVSDKSLAGRVSELS